jgi:hypothetical protein
MPKALQEGEEVSANQANGRQRNDIHSDSGANRMLIDILLGDEKRDITATRLKLLADGDAWKKMPARATAGNGDERR